MGIFYLDEHTSCYNYSKNIKEGFSLTTLEEGEVYQHKAEHHLILFMLEGSVDILIDWTKVCITSGNMLFIPTGSSCRLITHQRSVFVFAQFEQPADSCENLFLSSLSTFLKEGNPKTSTLIVKEKMQLFLNLLVNYLEDGANCVHLHEIKLKEMFWIFRLYYSKEEVAKFFFPIIGKKQDFKSKVLTNYQKFNTVQELAAHCNMSISTFKRQFMEEFNESPGQWMHEQLNNMIEFKLADESLSISEISDQLDFNSIQHFSRYWKKTTGMSPSEWRDTLKNKK